VHSPLHRITQCSVGLLKAFISLPLQERPDLFMEVFIPVTNFHHMTALFFAHASMLTFLQVCRLSRRRALKILSSPAPESSPASSTMVLYVTALLSRKANRFSSGVLIAADTLGSYGTLARFKDVNRVGAYGSHTIVGAAGDLSDFQVCSQLSAFAPCFSHHIILGHQGST
jgi:hypothetical protein